MDNQITPEEQDKRTQESDSFKLRRITALVLVIVTIGYLLTHDHNRTLEIMMLGMAGFLIGTSIISTK